MAPIDRRELVRARAPGHLTPDAIARVDLHVHPLVLELTGARSRKTGLESKFSVYFGPAVAEREPHVRVIADAARP